VQNPEPWDHPGSGGVGRLAGVAVQAVEFGRLDGLGETADRGLKFGEDSALLDHNCVQFLILALNVGEVSFEARQPILQGFVHRRAR